jgi:hypothetical protein
MWHGGDITCGIKVSVGIIVASHGLSSRSISDLQGLKVDREDTITQTKKNHIRLLIKPP